MSKIACTLSRGGDKMPEERKEKLVQQMLTFFTENKEKLSQFFTEAQKEEIEKKSLSDDLVKYCLNMPQLKLSNKDKQNPHGKIVVGLIF